jgi:hypothetical protein
MSKAEFLQAPLHALPYWLDLRCDPARCTKVVRVPLKLIAAKQGSQRVLREVIARLRCTQCGKPPSQVTITESPITPGGAHIAPVSHWSEVLVP